MQDFDTSFVLSIVAVTLEQCNQCGPDGPSPLVRVPAAGVTTSPPRRNIFRMSQRSKLHIDHIDGSSCVQVSRRQEDLPIQKTTRRGGGCLLVLGGCRVLLKS
jgi:hypothetical protein